MKRVKVLPTDNCTTSKQPTQIGDNAFADVELFAANCLPLVDEQDIKQGARIRGVGGREGRSECLTWQWVIESFNTQRKIKATTVSHRPYVDPSRSYDVV